MMESAADHNRAVYRRKEKAEHQVSQTAVCVQWIHKADLDGGLKVKTIEYLLL